jgi:hypothetical protein
MLGVRVSVLSGGINLKIFIAASLLSFFILFGYFAFLVIFT